MKIGTLIGLALVRLVVIATFVGSDEITSFKVDQTESATYKAISEAADLLIGKLGWSKDDVKISHIDTTDAKFGQTVVYEFDIEVGENVIPVRLSEDISSWKYLEELPSGFDATLTEAVTTTSGNIESNSVAAVLAPFQLSGPVELWIQDGEQLRLAVPHDVEAGVLKKVLLAEGAVVTVEGAREVSLEKPLQLPLPLQGISHESGLAASIIALADRLRYASRTELNPLLSLRIVGPTSLVASTTRESDATRNKLKVKRLAPGAVELVSREHQQEQALVSTLESSAVLSEGEPWLWPLPLLNGSDARLLNLEKILLAAVGPNAYKKGAFKLIRAKASAATFVQIEFQLEKKLADESFSPELWPEWRTKPLVQKLQLQVLAKVEGRQLLPVTVQQLKPYSNVQSTTWRAAMGNVSYSKIPKIFLLPSAMTLDPRWEGVMD